MTESSGPNGSRHSPDFIGTSVSLRMHLCLFTSFPKYSNSCHIFKETVLSAFVMSVRPSVCNTYCFTTAAEGTQTRLNHVHTYTACLVKYCVPFKHTTLLQSTVPIRCYKSQTDFFHPGIRSVPKLIITGCSSNAKETRSDHVNSAVMTLPLPLTVKTALH